MSGVDGLKVAVIGAGSRSFGPSIVRDMLLSDALHEGPLDIRLMDVVERHAVETRDYARAVAARLGRKSGIEVTTRLEEAVDGASFVVSAIEVNRFLYWSQDFHIPRKHGFRQVFGENGGPGGIFHALRNMGPTVEIARAMERLCPEALLLNFTNPEHKLCEAVTRLTSIRCVGLCHGYFMGLRQIAGMLGVPEENLDARACGINHFTWFQSIRDKSTREDLYPLLRQRDAEGDLLHDWHEIGLGRILFRRFGLWPSPAANHYGEYIRWAEEFVASELQFFYDPAEGHPWHTGHIPDFVYSLSHPVTERPLVREKTTARPPDPNGDLRPSGELAVPIMEAMTCEDRRLMEAVNVPNRGAIPNLPDETVVEVPAMVDREGIHRCRMEPLPEAIACLLRVQASIQQLVVEAYAEQSRQKLLQAVLLDPVVDSYRRAVEMVDEMLSLQAELLPRFR